MKDIDRAIMDFNSAIRRDPEVPIRVFVASEGPRSTSAIWILPLTTWMANRFGSQVGTGANGARSFKHNGGSFTRPLWISMKQFGSTRRTRTHTL